MVKILVVGDLHGRMPKIHFKEFEMIIQVGDVCEDREIGKIYKQLFKKGNKLSYEEYVKKYVGEKKLLAMEKRSLVRGREILKYLDSFNKPIIFVPGNWDQCYGPTKIKDMEKNNYNYVKAFYDWWLGDKLNAKLVKGIKNLVDSQYKLNEVLGINFIGYGLTSAPENLKNKSGKFMKTITKNQFQKLKNSTKKIEEKLGKVFKKRDKSNPLIFISHNIPHGTKLDKIKSKGHAADGKHAGSTIARKMCTKYKPILCLGGHIHEGKGRDKIGNTVVINPGYGQDAQVLIDLDTEKKKVKSVKFWKGKKR